MTAIFAAGHEYITWARFAPGRCDNRSLGWLSAPINSTGSTVCRRLIQRVGYRAGASGRPPCLFALNSFFVAIAGFSCRSPREPRTSWVIGPVPVARCVTEWIPGLSRTEVFVSAERMFPISREGRGPDLARSLPKGRREVAKRAKGRLPLFGQRIIFRASLYPRMGP